MVEAGDRQPRSLAEAFRTPVQPHSSVAVARLIEHLADLDAAYATDEDRRFLSLTSGNVPGAVRSSLAEIGAFVCTLPKRLVKEAA